MMNSLGTAFRIVRAARNWWTAILFKLGAVKEAEIAFRNGQRLRFAAGEGGKLAGCVSFFLDHPDGNITDGIARFRYRGRDIALDFGNGAVVSFRGSAWGKVLRDDDIAERTVIDIGCSLGDTMVEFAARGAARVVGIEMLPYRCALAVRNISLNGMEKICRVENAAIGGTAGTIAVDAAQEGSEHYRSLRETAKHAGRTIEIPVVTLADIALRHSVQKDAALKIDIQGGEFEALRDAPDDALTAFSPIVIRYYYGRDDRAGALAERLERAGFRCAYLKPKKWGCGYLIARMPAT